MITFYTIQNQNYNQTMAPSIAKLIENIISSKVDEFIDLIVKEYDGIEAENLKALWKKVQSTKIQKLTKPKTDPNQPKKPLNAYVLFCQEKRSETKKENPELSATEITKILAEKWQKQKNRSKWEKKNEELKKQYEIDMKKYNDSKSDDDKSDDKSDNKSDDNEKPKKIKKVKDNSTSVNTDGCTHIMSRGLNVGKPCGRKCVEDKNFCKIHDKEPKESKSKSVKPKSTKEETPKIIINKKIDKPWNKQTGIVFEKEDDGSVGKVIGKYNPENEEIEELEEEDIELCNKYNWEIKEDDEEDEKEEEEEEEDEEEDEEEVEEEEDEEDEEDEEEEEE